ncbi:MAG: hypothetical protein HUU02_16580 [Bacteroidetes bacterium]|nr:hypothetical protein [Bacteroidota bacterium]
MLKKGRKTVTKAAEPSESSSLPVKPLKGELLFKAILDQKFNEFGLSLREEFDRQVISGHSELRDAIFRERNERKRAHRLILGFLGLVVVLLGVNIFFVLNTTEKSVNSAVSKEFTVFEEKSKETTKSLFIPMQKSVEKNLNQVTAELSLSRGYIDVFALEGLARNGSRSAFEELVRTVNKGGAKGSFAANKLKELKDYYAILAEPKRQNLTLGGLSVVKAGATTVTDSLSAIELIYVLNSPGATIGQVHQILTQLWDIPLTNDHQNEFWNILQNSQNLPASIATCSLLQKNFGNRGSMYEFAKWKAFLESRM